MYKEKLWEAFDRKPGELLLKTTLKWQESFSLVAKYNYFLHNTLMRRFSYYNMEKQMFVQSKKNLFLFGDLSYSHCTTVKHKSQLNLNV